MTDFTTFREAYLETTDWLEDASNDNTTPELMEARVLRVWANYEGSLEAAIQITDRQECEKGEECVWCGAPGYWETERKQKECCKFCEWCQTYKASALPGWETAEDGCDVCADCCEADDGQE